MTRDLDGTTTRLIQDIFTNSPDAFMLSDRERRVIWCNPAFERLTGHALQGIAGQSLSFLYSENAAFHDAGDLLYNGLPLAPEAEHQVAIRHATGREIVTESTGWTIRDEHEGGHLHAKILRDKSSSSRAAEMKDRLLHIATEQSLNGTEKIDAVLSAICEYLLMPVGLVSTMQGEKLSVLHACSTLFPITTGAQYLPDERLCGAAMQTASAMEQHGSDVSPHPLAPHLGLGSYAACPLMIDGTREGLVSFLSPLRRQPLSEAERDILQFACRFTASQISQNRQLAALDRATRVDWLTGAGSSRQFHRDLEAVFVAARRSETPACLMLFDIDHFKSINDTFGHDVGDRVLADLSGLVRAHLGPRRRLYRVGGEEFGILLSCCDAGQANDLADDIRRAIQQHQFQGTDGRTITASFGVSPLETPIDSENVWLKSADVALYASKDNGRNRVTDSANLAGVIAPTGLHPTRARRYSDFSTQIAGT